MFKYTYSVILLVNLLLTACVNLKPIHTATPATYIIDAVVTPIKATPTRYSLLISTPKASPGLSDNHMAYSQQPHTLQYFAHNRWIDNPANMLLPLMVQTLQDSDRFQAVVATPYVGTTDLRLDTELLTLQQEFIQKPSVVKLTIRMQLIDLKTQRVIATQVFHTTQIADTDTPYGGVNAANKAVAQFLASLRQFCVTATVAKTSVNLN